MLVKNNVHTWSFTFRSCQSERHGQIVTWLTFVLTWRCIELVLTWSNEQQHVSMEINCYRLFMNVICQSRMKSICVSVHRVEIMAFASDWSMPINVDVPTAFKVSIVSKASLNRVRVVRVCKCIAMMIVYLWMTNNYAFCCCYRFLNSSRNNGTCTIISNTGFQCSCLFGYTGPLCELTINACASNPCRFGTCQQLTPGFYFCLCTPGYTGFNCQTEINECASFPCLNNGTCIDLINRFNCTCLSGYAGFQCQSGGFQCGSGPCLNNGSCSLTSTGYQCACSLGLTGARCEIDINECASSPCQNAGICLQPTLNRYECLCPTGKTHDISILMDSNWSPSIGYTGVNCEVMRDPCSFIACLNNGTCTRTSATVAVCSCSPGFSGSICQNQINMCMSAPCINGTCIPMANAYQCSCYPGYTGAR
jgi:hypothetical protein